jgi:hypothetical protein
MANSKVDTHFGDDSQTDVDRVRLNQQNLTTELNPHYDFIVCGSAQLFPSVR